MSESLSVLLFCLLSYQLKRFEYVSSCRAPMWISLFILRGLLGFILYQNLPGPIARWPEALVRILFDLQRQNATWNTSTDLKTKTWLSKIFVIQVISRFKMVTLKNHWRSIGWESFSKVFDQAKRKHYFLKPASVKYSMEYSIS